MTNIIIHHVDADGWELNKSDDRFDVGSDERISLWLSHFPTRGEVVLWDDRPHRVLHATLQGIPVESKVVPASLPRLLVIEPHERPQVVTEAPSGESARPVKETLWLTDVGRREFTVTRPLVAGDGIDIDGLESEGIRMDRVGYHAYALPAGILDLRRQTLPMLINGRCRRYDLQKLADMSP